MISNPGLPRSADIRAWETDYGLFVIRFGSLRVHLQYPSAAGARTICNRETRHAQRLLSYDAGQYVCAECLRIVAHDRERP